MVLENTHKHVKWGFLRLMSTAVRAHVVPTIVLSALEGRLLNCPTSTIVSAVFTPQHSITRNTSGIILKAHKWLAFQRYNGCPENAAAPYMPYRKNASSIDAFYDKGRGIYHYISKYTDRLYSILMYKRSLYFGSKYVPKYQERLY